jgi:hypothetical protein
MHEQNRLLIKSIKKIVCDSKAMEETTKNVTYDDLVQTRNIQILKSVVPFLDFRSQRPVAILIQYLELMHASDTFARRDNSMAACAVQNPSERRSAMLTAIRQYATPKEQETIDNLLNMLCVMDNCDILNNG